MNYRQRLPNCVWPLCLVIIAGCSSTQHATYVPDGRRGYVVTCGGLLSEWGNCLVKAGRVCGSQGYETIKGNEEDRSILIACGAARTDGAQTHSSP